MPPFKIETTTTKFTFDGTKEARADFAVTNVSGEPLRARAKVVPQNDAQAGWYTLEGEAVRGFSTDAAQEYAVRIALPEDAGYGSYGFRLDVVAEELPDENFALGPDVFVEYPEPPPPPPEEKKVPVWIFVAIGAGALLIVGAAIFFALKIFSSDNDVEVPSVIGLDQATAIAQLENACLPVPCYEVSATVVQTGQHQPGTVFNQSPSGGELPKGSTVELEVEFFFQIGIWENHIDDGTIDFIEIDPGGFIDLSDNLQKIICSSPEPPKSC